MRVAMIGTGYVGLVSGACFADFGHTVCCIDKDEGKIQRLREGIMPIYEPGLDQLVAQNVREGRLSFDTDAAEAVKQADAVFILTEWDQFRALDLDRVKLLVKKPVLIDLRNVYRPDDMRARGFAYTSIGRA